MLINLSNHPFITWTEKQKQLAKDLYVTIRDLPFPDINPSFDENEITELTNIYLADCIELFRDSNDPIEMNAIHIMGELTFCFSFIQLAKEKRIICLASTTMRKVILVENNIKTSVFEFVRFRSY